MLSLLTTRRFAPLFLCQFLAAFNDNFLKNALVALIVYAAVASRSGALVQLAGAIFIAPFFFLSGIGGEIADRFDKAVVGALGQAGGACRDRGGGDRIRAALDPRPGVRAEPHLATEQPAEKAGVLVSHLILQTEFRPFSRILRLKSPASLCPQNSVSRPTRWRGRSGG